MRQSDFPAAWHTHPHVPQVPMSLTREEYVALYDAVSPRLAWLILPGTTHSHPVTSLARREAEEAAVQHLRGILSGQTGQHIGPLHDNVILDVGGNPSRHHKARRTDLFSCCPTVDAADEWRRLHSHTEGRRCGDTVAACSCPDKAIAKSIGGFLFVHSLYHFSDLEVAAIIRRPSGAYAPACAVISDLSPAVGDAGTAYGGEVRWSNTLYDKRVVRNVTVPGNQAPYVDKYLEWPRLTFTTIAQFSTTRVVSITVSGDRAPLPYPVTGKDRRTFQRTVDAPIAPVVAGRADINLVAHALVASARTEDPRLALSTYGSALATASGQLNLTAHERLSVYEASYEYGLPSLMRQRQRMASVRARVALAEVYNSLATPYAWILLVLVLTHAEEVLVRLYPWLRFAVVAGEVAWELYLRRQAFAAFSVAAHATLYALDPTLAWWLHLAYNVAAGVANLMWMEAPYLCCLLRRPRAPPAEVLVDVCAVSVPLGQLHVHPEGDAKVKAGPEQPCEPRPANEVVGPALEGYRARVYRRCWHNELRAVHNRACALRPDADPVVWDATFAAWGWVWNNLVVGPYRLLLFPSLDENGGRVKPLKFFEWLRKRPPSVARRILRRTQEWLKDHWRNQSFVKREQAVISTPDSKVEAGGPPSTPKDPRLIQARSDYHLAAVGPFRRACPVRLPATGQAGPCSTPLGTPSSRSAPSTRRTSSRSVVTGSKSASTRSGSTPPKAAQPSSSRSSTSISAACRPTPRDTSRAIGTCGASRRQASRIQLPSRCRLATPPRPKRTRSTLVARSSSPSSYTATLQCPSSSAASSLCWETTRSSSRREPSPVLSRSSAGASRPADSAPRSPWALWAPALSAVAFLCLLVAVAGSAICPASKSQSFSTVTHSGPTTPGGCVAWLTAVNPSSNTSRWCAPFSLNSRASLGHARPSRSARSVSPRGAGWSQTPTPGFTSRPVGARRSRTWRPASDTYCPSARRATTSHSRRSASSRATCEMRVYGNCCGPGHTAPPGSGVDEVDEICCEHDEDYSHLDELDADERFVAKAWPPRAQDWSSVDGARRALLRRGMGAAFALKRALGLRGWGVKRHAEMSQVSNVRTDRDGRLAIDADGRPVAPPPSNPSGGNRGRSGRPDPAQPGLAAAEADEFGDGGSSRYRQYAGGSSSDPVVSSPPASGRGSGSSSGPGSVRSVGPSAPSGPGPQGENPRLMTKKHAKGKGKAKRSAPRQRQRIVRAPVAASYDFNPGMARTRPINHRLGGIEVVHTEFVGVIAGSVAYTNWISNALSQRINPANSFLFPWLSTMCQTYESYRFKYLELVYQGRTTTSTTGSVIMAIDYDPTDEAPTVIKDILQLQSNHDSGAWEPVASLKAKMPMLNGALPMRFIALPGNVAPADSDARTTFAGKVFVATIDQANTNNVGRFYVRYAVELYSPHTPDLASVSLRVSGAGSVSKTAVFGTAPTYVVNGTSTTESPVTASTNTLTFNLVGEFLVTSAVVGTGLNAPTLSGTATSSLLQNAGGGTTDFSNDIRVQVTNPGQTLIFDWSGSTTVTGYVLRAAPYTYGNA